VRAPLILSKPAKPPAISPEISRKYLQERRSRQPPKNAPFGGLVEHELPRPPRHQGVQLPLLQLLLQQRCARQLAAQIPLSRVSLFPSLPASHKPTAAAQYAQ
jgi:hypothetical protein